MSDARCVSFVFNFLRHSDKGFCQVKKTRIFFFGGGEFFGVFVLFSCFRIIQKINKIMDRGWVFGV